MPPALPRDAGRVPDFHVVGLGASAGGLAALEAFFRALPVDTGNGMAFVLVQHLAPDHKSLLAELIQRCTPMPVLEVTDGLWVQPRCIYVIPPGSDMTFLGGALHLSPQAPARALHLPVDLFFRSLAQELHERAIGIVFSGTGSDGTLGVRAIKAGGGMVMAQNPGSCEFDGMPRSAIATGQVDYELPPAEMPAALAGYARRSLGHTTPGGAERPPTEAAELQRILLCLRQHTGHDFSHYKPATIDRRVARRMAVHQIDTLGQYSRFLQQTAAEVQALFQDLLIGVTSFFRDPRAFAALEPVIERIFAGKAAGGAVRVWVPGCATGEEAYSIAILLQERAQAVHHHGPLQVFATDIDKRAIAAARQGVYPCNVAADITPARLARCFAGEREGSVYRVNKDVRDLLVFSEQDVIKDPPFTRLDLVSCRNLMIYMGARLQGQLIPLFHYALNPGGALFLGNSETVGNFGEIFQAIDRTSRLYLRLDDGPGGVHAAGTPAGRPLGDAALAGPDAWQGKPGPPQMLDPTRVAAPAGPSLRGLTEQVLLRHAALTGALVNARGDVLYLHGRSGMYLEPPPGEAGVSNILKMAREGLRLPLASSLQEAVASMDVVHCAGLSVRSNGHFSGVDLTVWPMPGGASAAASAPLFVLVLQPSAVATDPPAAALPPAPGAEAAPAPAGAARHPADAHVAALRQELRAKEDVLRASNQELEASIDELKAANEALQSLNEESQSSNEELETSKEELQSVNEELATVNAELQSKLADLARANNDMNNLLAGTGIATVFVDSHLRLLRFTPAAAGIIHLILSDVGRPVGHIVTKLVGYDRLVEDTQAVLDTLIPSEVTVQTTAALWYTLRIQPYRTLDNVIEGAVLTFVDITEIVHTREALHKANELRRLAVVVRDAHDAITVQDLHGRILAWNPGAVRMYGWTEDEALRMNVRERIPPGLQVQALERVHQLSQAEVLEPYLTQRIGKDGQVRPVSMVSSALFNLAGDMYAIATTERASPLRREPAPEPAHAPPP